MGLGTFRKLKGRIELGRTGKDEGFYLYPEKSSLISKRDYKVTGELHGSTFPVHLFLIDEVKPNPAFFEKKMQGSIEQKIAPCGRRAGLSLPNFPRPCIDQGDFLQKRAALALSLRCTSSHWRKVAYLDYIQALVGQREIDRLLGHSRKYDPTEFAKKSHVNAPDLLEDGESIGLFSSSDSSDSSDNSDSDNSFCTSLNEVKFNRDTSRTKTSKTLFDPHDGIGKAMSQMSPQGVFDNEIPKVAKSSFKFNCEPFEKECCEKLLEKVILIFKDEIDKSIQFDSKQATFRNRLKANGLLVDDLAPLLRWSEGLLHEDLAAIANGLQKLLADNLVQKPSDVGPATRFLNFWYGTDNPISKAIDNRILALTPFRSIIHTLSYKALTDWEQSLYLNGEIPSSQTLGQVYAAVFDYPRLLELSRRG